MDCTPNFLYYNFVVQYALITLEVSIWNFKTILYFHLILLHYRNETLSSQNQAIMQGLCTLRQGNKLQKIGDKDAIKLGTNNSSKCLSIRLLIRHPCVRFGLPCVNDQSHLLSEMSQNFIYFLSLY